MSAPTLLRRCAAEFLGTAFLLAIVVGSGIMGERLAGGNVAIALLANTLATGAGLIALILTFGPVSGAHFNPVVSLVELALGKLSRRDIPGYLLAQFVGAIAGVFAAHLMFGIDGLPWSEHERSGVGNIFSEFVATFGLIAVILSGSRHRPHSVPYAVGCYITAGYWFTASTAFANPAVALARSMTNTFSGIRLADVPAFMLVEVLGAASAFLLFRWLLGESATVPEIAKVPAAQPQTNPVVETLRSIP